MVNDYPHPHPGPRLASVAEKSLPAKCKPGSLTYCPTMDLIALATDDEELRVFRLNGQRVFGGSFCGDPYLDETQNGEIRGLIWRSNGEVYPVSRALHLYYQDISSRSLARMALSALLTRTAAKQSITTQFALCRAMHQVLERSPQR